jgi:hypothetical protein
MQYEVQHCASVVHAWPLPVHAVVAAGLLPQLASVVKSTNPAVKIARPSIRRTIPHSNDGRNVRAIFSRK